MRFDINFLLLAILTVMGIMISLLYLNSRLIGWKDRDRYFNLQRKLLPHEKELMRKYWKKIAFTIVAGISLLIIVYFLHTKGILLSKPKK